MSSDHIRWEFAAAADAVAGGVHLLHPHVDPCSHRGVVLSVSCVDLPAGRYSWLAHDRIERDPVVAVVAVARRLAGMCADAGDAAGARDALLRGLAVAPADEDLWRDALRLAARLGSRADVKAVADSMYTAITTHGSPLGATAETDELVEELLPGYRRSAA